MVASSFGIQVPCGISFSGLITACERNHEGRRAGSATDLPEPRGLPWEPKGAHCLSSAFGTISKSLLRDLSVFLLLCIFTPITPWGLFIFMSNIYLLGDCHRALYLP